MKHYLLTAAMSLAALGCNTTKKMGETTAAFSSVTLDQGGCFGTCPIYVLEVLADGSATYKGERYAPYKGLHLATVSPDSFAMLAAQVEDILAKADKLPREIDSNVADAASSRISIVSSAGDTIEFRGTIEYAEPVEQLRQTLRSIAKSSAWQRSPDAEPATSSRTSHYAR